MVRKTHLFRASSSQATRVSLSWLDVVEYLVRRYGSKKLDFLAIITIESCMQKVLGLGLPQALPSLRAVKDVKGDMGQDVAQLVAWSAHSIHESLGSGSSPPDKTDVVLHPCNPSTREAETRE